MSEHRANERRWTPLAAGARAAGRFAFDTEFMGEGRYRTLLCLIQLAVPDGADPERIELIDPLEQDLDGAPLAAILADPAIQIVVHAGRQDVALVRRRFATDVRNVFDTQIAAGFAGLGAQSSYDTLLAEILDVRLAKSASFTRWDTRPLSPEQLAVRARGRRPPARARGRARTPPDRARPPGVGARGVPLPRARQRRARPRHGVRAPAADSRPRAPPRRRSRASSSRGASARPPARTGRCRASSATRRSSRSPSANRPRPASSSRSAASTRRACTAAPPSCSTPCTAASERPPEPLPQEGRPPPPDPEDGPLIALSEAFVRARAREAGLAYELLAARADLQAIVAARRVGDPEADVRTLRGWRRELVGTELLELLDGRVSLSVRDRAISVTAN